MGARGAKVKDITAEFDVQIKFPERDTTEGADLPIKDIDENAEPGPNDVIRITGRPENCEAAKKALLEQVPITIDVEVPNELHRLLAGQKRRELMQTYDVHILLPPNEDNSDLVKVTGTPTNVEKAKQALADRIVDMEKEKEDRLLRSFELKFKVDPEYHPLVIGKGGSVITKIRTDFGVQINLPKRGEPDDDIITIQGYEDKAQQAKDAIMAIVHQLDNQCKEEVDIDPRVHRRLIGLRGKNIRRIMDEFKVDIRFPKHGDDSTVVITGDEDNVLDAKDHLLNLAEEYLQDVADRYQPPAAPSLGDFGSVLNENTSTASAGANANANAASTGLAGFVVKGGPWEQRAPDTASTHEFPTMPGAPQPQQASPAAWGPRR